MTRKHGGARPGAGRKKGKVSQAKRELAEMAKEHAEQALQVLVNIALSGESEAARVSAANAILDRGYGKPMQGVDHKSSDGSMTPPTRIELIPLLSDDNSKN
ncbi:hypothetical protein ACFOLL_04445 [Falsochrobactrum ovis]|uniref:Uncharacterized protein n=1 Tax=Falsochrobactrum ovis TaxID=1293442 RepID=A0A364JW25_9HYPH|nr:hypothetical protein [Falsochrobactrum ovis]RAK29139.1 hypothetical protein C7374_105190 [Falsochrobactrum ovis]